MGDLYSNKLWIEDTSNKVNQYKDEKEKALISLKAKQREENQNKFNFIKEILKENLDLQKIIKFIIAETKFKYKEIRKIIIILETSFFAVGIAVQGINCYYNINNKTNLILTFLVTSVIWTIIFFMANEITKKILYKKYIKRCKDIEINTEDLILVMDQFLYNYEKLLKEIPLKLLNHELRNSHKSNFDKYIYFISINNKSLRKKIRSKKLKIYKGIFCKNNDFINDMETLENNYFNTVFTYNRKDTLEEAVKSFLEI
ncbi:hypothetical protein SAMN02745134_01806 [Clostridium acidisoli DSM 12555]|uniref:Uncharacterized protein n=1 Tax=Clostridium acidisoli DSM 12555 TaxID=1121291 RepID=A0A1W1XHF1_9CLOT|nr:hypothetical protein [Clostridium acidisoli]SMC23204.1 hypothetical protein SAMN02745134_01806 [Clostridium acidisoli DSM 12555]